MFDVVLVSAALGRDELMIKRMDSVATAGNAVLVPSLRNCVAVNMALSFCLVTSV